MTSRSSSSSEQGALLILILVFGAVFFMIAAGFMNYVVTQSKLQTEKQQQASAQQIAEAGLDYYKWYLAHFPNDYTDGTNHAGPYVHAYDDPSQGEVGKFSLTIATSSICGDVNGVVITSTGYTDAAPTVKRTVSARYARPTVADYSYIINSNVWAGADRTITGPYYSNGGIRMDGTNNSTVSSGQSTWDCTSSYGCSPEQKTAPGVTGSGPNSNLWQYPTPPINFTGLTVDLSNMEDKAKNDGGIYLAPSGAAGYHVVFQPNGTFDLYQVNSTQNEPRGYAWGRKMNIIKSTKYLGNYTIPTSCPVIYVQDQLWLDGTVDGKVSIAAADVGNSGTGPSIILNDNITYANATSGLLAIGQNDVLVGFVVPNDMTLNGIFVAQNGHFGRNYYDYSVPSAWDTYVERNSLTINGTIVSNGSVGTKWICSDMWGNTYYCSGFATRTNTYDRTLAESPPPLTPFTSDTYRFLDWREQN